jgi:fructokinase
MVAALGEALFDCFPGRAILGGAPVNFAVHLQQLLRFPSEQSAVVSAIGRDELGSRLVDEISSRNVCTDFVQLVPDRETGQVQVTLSASGDPSYHIAENAAWDFIQLTEPVGRLVEGCRAVYFGTLAQRSRQSREAIQQLVQSTPESIRILDLNLRPPYIDAAVIKTSLELASVVKLSEEELRTVGDMLAAKLGSVDGGNSFDELAVRLLTAYELDLVVLTRGARGTVLYTPQRRLEGREPPYYAAAANADGVGAGDACCAGLVFGLLRDWPLDRTLDLANRMGAFVASQPGGTPTLSSDLRKLAGL